MTHDFGTILATGQELLHRFTLENPTDQVLRLVDPIAYTPCCSAIGPLPEAIPPGETVEVPVVYNTVGRNGPGRLNFSVRADHSDGPAWDLVLLSNLVPAWEVEPIGGDLSRLPIGEPAEQTFRVISRHQGESGLPAPTLVETTGPIAAEFVGPIEEVTDPDGLVTNTRVVRATLSAAAEPGARAGQLVFRWPDEANESRSHQLRWHLAASMTVTPPALILSTPAEPASRSVIVRSSDQPFLVVEVAGPLDEPVELPTEPRLAQPLNLTIDPSRLDPGVSSTIQIRTDHPTQAEVSFTVLLLPTSEGEE